MDAELRPDSFGGACRPAENFAALHADGSTPAAPLNGAFRSGRVESASSCARLILFPGKPAARREPAFEPVPADAAFSPHAFRRAGTARSIRRRPTRSLAARF